MLPASAQWRPRPGKNAECFKIWRKLEQYDSEWWKRKEWQNGLQGWAWESVGPRGRGGGRLTTVPLPTANLGFSEQHWAGFLGCVKSTMATRVPSPHAFVLFTWHSWRISLAGKEGSILDFRTYRVMISHCIPTTASVYPSKEWLTVSLTKCFPWLRGAIAWVISVT